MKTFKNSKNHVHLDIIFKEEKSSYVNIYLKQCQIVLHWLDSWIPKNLKIKSPSLLFRSQNLLDGKEIGNAQEYTKY